MTTKDQALKRLNELEEKVDKQVKGLQEEVKQLMSANQDLAKIADKANADKAELARKLEGYSGLQKALGQIRVEGGVTNEEVRVIVQEEIVKLNLTNPGAAEVKVTESIPYVDLKVSSPWVPLDESTAEGQIAVLAIKGKLQEPFNLGTVAKQRELEYAVHGKTSTIQKALDALVGKYKVLERKVQGNQYVYSVRADAKSRVKESTTREAMEVKEEK